LETLPRADIARAALAEGRAIKVKSIAEACEVSNLYGPEHLAIRRWMPTQWIPKITAAGAVFVGRTPLRPWATTPPVRRTSCRQTAGHAPWAASPRPAS
jgi:histidinol dehydrogenase